MVLLMKEKTIETGGEVIKVSLEEKESINVKDTVVILIYERLFEKVVELINRQINGHEIGKLNYGILDIHAWEELFGKRPKSLFINNKYVLEYFKKLRKISIRTNLPCREVEKAYFKKDKETK